MEQNNYTELPAYAFDKMYNENGPPDPKSGFVPDFPRFSVGNRIFEKANEMRNDGQSCAEGIDHACICSSLIFVMSGRHGPCHTAPIIGPRSADLLKKIPDILGKNADLGFRGSGRRGFFTVNIKKRLARKLRIMILLHLELVTFRFHFGRSRQIIIAMFFRPSGRDHDAQHQLFFFLETPGYLK